MPQPQTPSKSSSPWWEKGLSIPLLYEQGLGSLPANGYRGDVKTWGKSGGKIPKGSMAPLPAPDAGNLQGAGTPTSGAAPVMQTSISDLLERYNLISPSKNDHDGTDGHDAPTSSGNLDLSGVGLPDGWGRTAAGLAGGALGFMFGGPMMAPTGWRGGTGIFDYFNGSGSGGDGGDPTGGLSEHDHTGGQGGGYGGMGGDYGVGGMRRGGGLPRPGRARGGRAPLPPPGRRIVGPGTGRSDSVPAVLNGMEPIDVSDGEYVIPADVVAAHGDGSTDAGARKLDAMVMKTRRAYAKKLNGLPAPRKSRGGKWFGGLFDDNNKSQTTQELPEYLKQLQSIFTPMVMTAASQTPGTGTVAGFSPDQVAGFNALRELATKDPTGYFAQMGQASDLARGSTANTKAATDVARSALVSPGSIGRDSRADTAIRTLLNPDKYSTSAIKGLQNPYDALVTDRALRSFDRDAAVQTAASERDRASRRAFGTRASLAEAEDRRNIGERRDDMLSSLNQAGFDKAVAQFNANNATKQTGAQGALAGVGQEYDRLSGNQANQLAIGQNRLNVANVLGNLGAQGSNTNLDVARFLSGAAGDTRQTGIGNAQILSGVGGAYQQQQQQMLDAPWTQVNRLNSIFSGAPMNSTQTTSGGSNTFGTLAGLGLLGAGLWSGGKFRRGGRLCSAGKKRGFADGGYVAAADELVGLVEAGQMTPSQAQIVYERQTGRDLFKDFPGRFPQGLALERPLPPPGASMSDEAQGPPIPPPAERRSVAGPAAPFGSSAGTPLPPPDWTPSEDGPNPMDEVWRAVGNWNANLPNTPEKRAAAAAAGQLYGDRPMPAPARVAQPTATAPRPAPAVAAAPAAPAGLPPPASAKSSPRRRPLDEVRQMIRNPGAARPASPPAPLPRPYPAGASASPLPPPSVVGEAGDDTFGEAGGDEGVGEAGDQPGGLETYLSNPLTIAGLHMLASRNPSFGGAVGEAGIGLLDYTMKRRADQRAAVREARADRREERIEARDQARTEREESRDAVKDKQWAAEMDEKRLDREAKRAYEAARLGQFAQAISIRERNLQRLVAGGAHGKADVFNRKIKEKMADAIAEAQVSGDTDEVKRLMTVYGQMMAGDDLDNPEGFVAGDDL